MSYYSINSSIDKDMRIEKARLLLVRLRAEKEKFEELPLEQRKLGDVQLDDEMNFFAVRDKILRTDLGTPQIENEEVLFHKLAEFYEIVEPNWRASFNELNRKNPRYGIAGNIGKAQHVIELLESVEGAESDNASLIAINMYLANRIAHVYGMARDRLLEDELGRSDVHANVKTVSKKMKRYFIDKEQGKTRSMSRQKSALYDLGITDEIIERIEHAGVGELVSEEIKSFVLKDAMMMAFIDRAQKREINPDFSDEDLFSCGKTVDQEGKDVLVIDLPFFGQFSVHMQDPRTISAMRSMPYHKFVYALESVMLTEGISLEAEEDLEKVRTYEKLGKTEAEALKAVASERVQNDEIYGSAKADEAQKYAHYLTVKSGKSKKILDELYDDR